MRRGAAPAVEALGVGIVGLVHAAAAGAVILTGLNLAVPGLVDTGTPAEAAAASVALGLACLRVPLESGDLHGTFAPLSGLLLTLWGLHAAVRRAVPRERSRTRAIVVSAAGFAAACTGAAAMTAAASTVEASLPGAAVAGLVWGALAGALASRAAGGVEAHEPGAAFRWARPGVRAAVVAGGVAGIWLVGAVVLRGAGLPLREAAGVVVLSVAAAPNAVAALAVVGLGGSVDVALTGTGLADPVTESLSLWEWRGSGAAPPLVWILVLAPLTGAVAGARADGRGGTLARGIRNGAVFGVFVVLVGWAGSFGATAAAAEERASVRLGFAGGTTFALAVAWGIAGAVIARLPWPARSVRGPKVADP